VDYNLGILVVGLIPQWHGYMLISSLVLACGDGQQEIVRVSAAEAQRTKDDAVMISRRSDRHHCPLIVCIY